jgi:hypothetical protein
LTVNDVTVARIIVASDAIGSAVVFLAAPLFVGGNPRRALAHPTHLGECVVETLEEAWKNLLV